LKSAYALLLGLLLGGSWLHAEERPLDTVFFADGNKRPATVVGRTEDTIKLRYPSPEPGRPEVTVTEPLARIEQIQFADEITAETRERLRASPEELARLWGLWAPFVDVPRSPAPEIGLLYAETLLESDTPEARGRALGTFSQIEERSWDEQARAGGKQGRLLALIELGKAEEAVIEARKLATESEDPKILIQAKLILAAGALQDLRQLLEENPRWHLDPRVRPERERLYHEAVDLFLFPYLFHGSESASSARGLWGAIEVYQLIERPELVRETAQDLGTLYPDTPQAADAALLLQAEPDPNNENSES